ncbi:MAG: hypothetical protein V2I36_17750 [Desulfopila sp.]|jgi:hypothetical protein|nr:hypothetical protein [Desulfopila sp.]
MKTCIEKFFMGSVVVAALLLSSCAMVPRHHIGDTVIADQRIDLQSTTENVTWSTDDLSIHYGLVKKDAVLRLSGSVEISTSVTNTFPLADYLYIYLYLLDSEGVVISRHTLRPNISRYNMLSKRTSFSATLPKEPGTAYMAFGYFGNFVSIETVEGGGRGGYEKIEWEIYHDPFT